MQKYYILIDELYHYNPNHDRLGRFSSGPGGGPNDSKVLPKGYKLNSVRGYSDEEMMISSMLSSKKRAEAYRKTGRPLYTYNPEDKWDRSVYKGPFVRYLVMSRGKQFVDECSYKTVKDLKMPTREERVNEFKALYNDKKYNKVMAKELATVQKNLIKYEIGSPKELKRWGSVDVKKLKTANDTDWETAYKIFNHAMEAQHAGKSTSEYMRRMASKYDAMVDDNNQRYYNGVHDPIIIFKAGEVLKEIDAKNLTIKEIQDSDDYVRKELAKHGHLPKL